MKRLIAVFSVFAAMSAVVAAQDFNAAIDKFNAGATALETNKTEALENFRAALAQFELCEEEEAAEQVAKCKEIIPGVLLSIAKEQINGAEYDAAIETLKETASLAREYGVESVKEDAESLVPNVYMRKGSSLLKNKDFEGAADALAKVTELSPENGNAFLLRGQALLQVGKTDEAVASLEAAAEKGQEAKAKKLLSTTFLKQGQSLLKAGKNAEAIEALEKSNSYLESANAYKLIASALTKSGKNADAISAYKKYLEVAPTAKDADDILFTIAATAQKCGDKATAREYYTKLKGNAKYGAQAEAQLKTL